MFTGAKLIEHIVLKLEEDDIRVYDHNIVIYINKMSNLEFVNLLKVYVNKLDK